MRLWCCLLLARGSFAVERRVGHQRLGTCQQLQHVHHLGQHLHVMQSGQGQTFVRLVICIQVQLCCNMQLLLMPAL